MACLVAAPAWAQSGSFPYESDRTLDPWLAVGGVGLGALGLVAASHQKAPDSLTLAALDAGDLPGIDRSAAGNWSPGAATASDVLVWSALAVPAVYAVAAYGGDEEKTLLLLYGETLLLTNAVAQVTKAAVGRIRPYAYDPSPEVPPDALTTPDVERSFFSSHAANSFAAAVFLGTAHGKIHPESGARAWVWAGGLAVATVTSALRVVAGKHFPTDVLAGAAIGSGTAWLVLELHEVSTADPVGGAPARPSLGLTRAGPGIAWTFRF